jgi:hypothetical protein
MSLARELFLPGDLVTVDREGKDVGILIKKDISISDEPFWYVFHFESKRNYKVFEKYLSKIKNDEKE